jgi:hypothetical protein
MAGFTFRRQPPTTDPEPEIAPVPPISSEVRRTALRAAVAHAGTRTITAAVSRVDLEGASWKAYKFGDREWQDDAWRLYDITGQLRFVANWVGSCVSRCILRVHEIDEHGDVGAVVDDPEISQLAAGPLGLGDARAEMLRLLGIDLFVPGEAFMIAESEGASDGSDLWWVVTARQIKKQGDMITVVRSPVHGGGTFTYRDGVDLILRCWTPHPHDTNEPDSATRSAIPDLREIEALRRREFAELDSRLIGAGIMFVPDSMDLPRAEDDPEGVDGFSAMLMRTMATSLRDRSSAAAMVPIVVTGPGPDIDKIKHVTFWSELSAQITTMRQNALTSLGESLDIPPEVLKGLGSSNHWSAWAISDEAVTTQIKPVLSRIASALTLGYLTPALESLGYDDPTRYTYQFDTSRLTTRPNRTADAVTYHERGLISDDATRNAGAWHDSDAPDLNEQARRLARELALAAPQIALSDPGIRELLGLPGAGLIAPISTEPVNQPANPVTQPEENGPPAQPITAEGPPTDQQTPPSVASTWSMGNHLTVAVSMAARRAMALAGGRLVSHRQRDRYATVPRYQLTACHGAVAVDQIPPLLRGAWPDLDLIANSYSLDHVALERLLTEFCSELLLRGIAYSDDLVVTMLAAPGVLHRLNRSTP